MEENIGAGTEMTETQRLFEERRQRVFDAIALKEPDRVPCIPSYTSFPFLWAGYTMKDVLYDAAKAQDALKKYLLHFEPDMNAGYSVAFAGQGPLLEKYDPLWLEWAGKPGSSIPDTSVHQYIEKAYMEEDDYPEFLSDMTGWILRRYLPRSTGSLGALEHFDIRGGTGFGFAGLCIPFLMPGVKEAFDGLAELAQMVGGWGMRFAQDNLECEQLGFPVEYAATASTAYDCLSDSLRGTLPSSIDMIERPDDVLEAVERFYPLTVQSALGQAAQSTGRIVFIPLHKGMDGFMSDEQYRRFYWDTLLRMCNALIDAGLIPWVYTEGPYDSRIECLKELPKGKTWIHFEDADMKRVKRELGDTACLSGGIRSDVLVRGTVQQTVDAVKANMDILAPGGGYIFDISDTLEDCRPENVEALFETVRTYGRYHG